ncbi:hypothetical protein [Streptomyces fungicidicus]|uniref:Uncharacterized protein n=1 Tax=Streptomyces fungicidicus TaxID=68203 RepID=A0ACC7Y7Z3_9ACTN|nr:hypothetical protein [Streptomyces fungicidicus]NUV77947.1 hypothetical protein [Streptomyces fungicidicus]
MNRRIMALLLAGTVCAALGTTTPTAASVPAPSSKVPEMPQGWCAKDYTLSSFGANIPIRGDMNNIKYEVATLMCHNLRHIDESHPNNLSTQKDVKDLENCIQKVMGNYQEWRYYLRNSQERYELTGGSDGLWTVIVGMRMREGQQNEVVTVFHRNAEEPYSQCS